MKHFIKHLNSKVDLYKQAFKLNEGKAFGMWYAIDGLGMDETDAYEAVSVDGGNDKGIDLFSIDNEAERVIIAQFKFNVKCAYKGKKEELLSLIHTSDWLKDPETFRREGRKDLEVAAHEYLKATEEGYSVEYLYVYCGPRNKDVDDAARIFNVSEAAATPSRNCRIVNADALLATYQEGIDQSTRIPKGRIPCLENSRHEEKGNFGKAIVATISAKSLADLYLAHGDRLFDRNVRLFLGTKNGSVNASIAATLKSTEERKDFWAYNNGVTFICDDYSPSKNEIILHNFSIVNGCQTTVSLGNAGESAVSDSRVLVRFIAAPEKKIDSIILYNNSQNPIRPWDLIAQNKHQKKLKKDLGALLHPYLYVLRKGEIRQLPSKDRKRFKRDGKIQAIRYDLNAQYLAAFRGLPAIAYKDKGKIFTTHLDEVFPPQIRPEEIVLIWQAGNVARDLVRKELANSIESKEDARTEILKRGSTYFIIAIMGLILHERNGKIFLNKIKAEVASSKKTTSRLRNYATLALEWYVEIAAELTAEQTSVASLVRTQDGWRRIFPKITAKLKIYSMSKSVMEAALHKL